MKRLLILFVFGLAAASGRASILITFDVPDQRGGPGDTLVYTGVLSNGGLETIFFNSNTLNLAGSGFLVTDLFFLNVPFSLDPGQSSSSIELFNVRVNDPFTDLPGAYAGTYALVGGIDSNAQNIIGSAEFAVTVGALPEPSTVALLVIGLVALVGLHRRRQYGLTRVN